MGSIPAQAEQLFQQPGQHEIENRVLANDAQLALCSLYANRWHTMKRLHRVCTRLGLKAELKVWDQFLIRRTGQRMVTFISDIVRLPNGHKVSMSGRPESASVAHGRVTMLAVLASTMLSHECILAVQVAAAVFSFRGTKLNKAGNLRADLHLMKDLNDEMVITQRASTKVQSHMRRLQEQHQSVKWSFYTTGRCFPHSQQCT